MITQQGPTNERSDAPAGPIHPREASIFDRRSLVLGLLQGSVLLAVVLAVFFVAQGRGRGADTSRALTFATLILGNVALIASNHSHARGLLAVLGIRNPGLWLINGATLIMLVLVLGIPALRGAFHFGALGPDEIVVMAAAADQGRCPLRCYSGRFASRKNSDPSPASTASRVKPAR